MFRDAHALTATTTRRAAPSWMLAASPIQRAAMELHAAGLNVIPLPRVKTKDFNGKKPPFGGYSILFTTRLHPDDLIKLFYRANVGVIAGRLSQNLFVLDCDSPHEFDRVGGELARRDIAAWVSRSGRGGHFWLRCAEGEVANTKLSEALQVIGGRGYVVAPPSVHPSGAIYGWVRRDGELPPQVSIDALDFLPLTLAKARRGQLPKVARQVLAEGKLGEYASWSEAELAAAMSLAKAGYGEDEIVDVFEQHNPPHFAKKKKPADWLRRYVIPKAIAQADGDRQTAHAGIAWANSRSWPGRTGESDRAVFVALCQRAALDGREHFRASLRELSELSGLAVLTVRKALARLARAGLVRRADKYDKASLAALFSLSVPVPRVTHYMPCSGSVSLTPNSDAWHRQALGKSAESVWRVLLTRGELTREEIAEATGRTARTVGRALDKLQAHGLAEPIGIRWAAEPTNAEGLRCIAAACGTLGRAETRRAKYAEARALRAGELIRRQKVNWELRRLPGTGGAVAMFGLAEMQESRRWAGNAAGANDLAEIAAKCGTAGRAERRRQLHTKQRSVDVSRAILRRKRLWERKYGRRQNRIEP